MIRAVGDRGPLAHRVVPLLGPALGRAPDCPSTRCTASSPTRPVARALHDRPVRVDGQLWDRVPAAGAAEGAMPRWDGSLEAWLAMVPDVRRLVQGPDQARWIRDLLVHDLPGLLADAGRLPPTRLTELADTVGAVLASLPPHDLARVPVEARAGAWLAGQARWGDLERYLALRAERPGDFPTRVEGDRVLRRPARRRLARAPRAAADAGGRRRRGPRHLLRPTRALAGRGRRPDAGRRPVRRPPPGHARAAGDPGPLGLARRTGRRRRHRDGPTPRSAWSSAASTSTRQPAR